MTEQIINMEKDKAFLKIKEELVKRSCTVISEELSKQIAAKQGSLWGMSPKTAQKIMMFNFEDTNSGTRVKYSSKLGTGWKNLTIIGTALSIVVVGICLWIALDLNGFLVSQQPSSWGWLISVGSSVNIQRGQSLVYLTEILGASLTIIIAVEIVIASYAYRKKDMFAKKILDVLK